jgi:hypothetical protein
MITSNNNAIELQYKTTFMNVIGCVLGTPGWSDTYESAYPASADNTLRTIWRLGYGGPSWAGDTNVKATLLRHRNFDCVTQGADVDPSFPDTLLPPSLYLAVKPSWWGDLPWPSIGPDVPGLVNKIPAELRYEAMNTTSVRPDLSDPNEMGMSAEFVLRQNYPNPFNPTTAVSYQLSAVSKVKLVVYDILGRELATLVNEVKQPGTYSVLFNASGLASGMYLYRLHASLLNGNATHVFNRTSRMMLLK